MTRVKLRGYNLWGDGMFDWPGLSGKNIAYVLINFICLISVLNCFRNAGKNIEVKFFFKKKSCLIKIEKYFIK
jgi:hypothetical protein